jgi:hypothetical protein
MEARSTVSVLITQPNGGVESSLKLGAALVGLKPHQPRFCIRRLHIVQISRLPREPVAPKSRHTSRFERRPTACRRTSVRPPTPTYCAHTPILPEKKNLEKLMPELGDRRRRSRRRGRVLARVGGSHLQGPKY